MHATSTTPLPKIAFLGAGSMGGAVLTGLLASDLPLTEVWATNRTEAKAQALADAHPGGVLTSVATGATSTGNLDAARGAGVVIVGVKPYMVDDLLAEIAPALQPGAIVVSLAAGIRLERIEQSLPAGVEAARVMPNTPATVQRAVSGLCLGGGVSEANAELVRAIFATVGMVEVIPESLIDEISAISGSGGAYFYLFLEKLAEQAVRIGFTTEQADRISREVFIGAANLLDATGEDPSVLRRNITSPGGTTERAIAAFEEGGLAGLVARAVDAAIARSREMAAE